MKSNSRTLAIKGMSQKAAWLNYELGVTRKHSKPYRMGVTKEVAGLTKKIGMKKSPVFGLFSEMGSTASDAHGTPAFKCGIPYTLSLQAFDE